MKNPPALFSRDEITKFIEPIKSIKDRIDFFNFQLTIYEKAYVHLNDDDIAKYIDKYNLKNIAESKNPISAQAHNDLMLDIENEHRNFKFKSIKYTRLQFDISQLTIFVKYHLTNLNFVNKLFSLDIELHYEILHIFNKISSFKDDKEALEWISDYYSIISDVSSLTDDFCFEKLFEKYNIAKKYPHYKPNLIQHARFNTTNYSTFKRHLQSELIPFIEKYQDNLGFDVLVNEAIKKYPDKFKDDNDKFPILDFNSERIQIYCNKVMREIEDKIEYFLHILQHYSQLDDFKKIVPENAHDCIKHIKKELKHFKALYKLKKGKEKDSNNISKKLDNINQTFEGHKRDNKKKIRANNINDLVLIKHYFTIAVQSNNIPSLPQLSIDIKNKSFWSKKLYDSTFLYLLSKKIESKIVSKRLNNKTLNLFDRLKDDCDLKLKKALKKENSKTGQTNRKNKCFNENQINDEEDGDSDFTA